MDWIIFTSILWILTYSIWVLWLYWGENTSKNVLKNSLENPQKKGVSVLIPIRNEAENIEKLVHSLESQTFPSSLVEFIFIDDHSSDDSFLILEKILQEKKNCFIFQLPVNMQGKKSALSLGIEKSHFDYVLTTDADCLHPKQWVETMLYHHLQHKSVFTSGMVKYAMPKNALESFVKFESEWLQSISTALYTKKRPILASGANMLFSKDAFYRVGGYQKHAMIASGDDIFLLHDMKKHFPIDKIQCISSPETLLRTNYPIGLKEFIHQRLRWAHKMKYYKDQDSLVIGFFIACMSFLYLVLFFGLLMQGFLEFLCFTFIKLALDFFIVRQRGLSIFVVFAGGIIYPLYSLGIVIWTYIGRLSWKGRLLRS